jgi:16S rRNA (adenine1518-N6/adenine1519-N6)-dimethyltransferase
MNKKNINYSNFKPKKYWSQNFLRDDNIARKIASCLQFSKNTIILEIGPGTGKLTHFLLPLSNKVLAIEIDSHLAHSLPEKLNHAKNLQVINIDFLKIDLSDLLQDYKKNPVVILGNLPYHITSPIIFKILESYQLFTHAILMMQKEVCLRITAPHGNKDYGILSIFCQFYADVKYLFTVPSHLFLPPPKVDSGVVQFTFKKEPEKNLTHPSIFKDIVRKTFGQRRKMLRNTLSKLISKSILSELKFDLSRRPETLSVAEFIDLSNQIHQIQTGDPHGKNNSGYRSQ